MGPWAVAQIYKTKQARLHRYKL